MVCRHETLEVGERCPVCGRGRLYRVAPGVEIRLDGHALLSAVRYVLEKFRCSACGQVFTAAAPAEAGADKYSARARAVLVLSRYYLGVPLGFDHGAGHFRPLKIMVAILKLTFSQWVRFFPMRHGLLGWPAP